MKNQTTSQTQQANKTSLETSKEPAGGGSPSKDDLKQKVKLNLRRFNGSETFFRCAIHRNFLFTEGVNYLAESCEAFWLITHIFSCQYMDIIREQEFQLWELVRDGDGACLKCTDGNCNVIFEDVIKYTDFPLDSVKLYFTNTVLLLPSEY